MCLWKVLQRKLASWAPEGHLISGRIPTWTETSIQTVHSGAPWKHLWRFAPVKSIFQGRFWPLQSLGVHAEPSLWGRRRSSCVLVRVSSSWAPQCRDHFCSLFHCWTSLEMSAWSPLQLTQSHTYTHTHFPSYQTQLLTLNLTIPRKAPWTCPPLCKHGPTFLVGWGFAVLNM